MGEDSANRSTCQHSQLPWRLNRTGKGAAAFLGEHVSGGGKGSDAER